MSVPAPAVLTLAGQVLTAQQGWLVPWEQHILLLASQTGCFPALPDGNQLLDPGVPNSEFGWAPSERCKGSRGQQSWGIPVH